MPSQPPKSFPPGPPPREGHPLRQLQYLYRFLTDPTGFIGGRFREYGDIYYAPSKDGGLYVLRHPEHNREVLVTHAASYRKKHTAFERLSKVLGNGLLNSDGDTWKRHRRMIQPSFHPRRLAEYSAVMTQQATQLAERFRSGERYDISREMMELTLRIVCQTLFGHDASGDIDKVGRAMACLSDAAIRPDLLPQWVPTPMHQRLQRSISDLDTIMYSMIKRRRQNNSERTDLLQALVSAVDEEGDGKSLTEREVRDQLVTMFLAGHETTSHALTWTWYLLSQNPEVEEKLFAELDMVLGGRAVSYEDLPRLVYTEQVLKESMRLYPPVFMLGRRAHEDTEIGGYPVAAGSEVVLWIYMTHHDPRWYPQPESFRPERFCVEAEARLPKNAYLPFGAGSRACIGKVFAMLEAKIVLATLAQRFRFRLVPEQRVALHPRITLAPRYGMQMTLQQRAPTF